MEPAVSRIYEANSMIYGGGVAIFHLASSRVVLCHHPKEGHWFLPKGRRDAGEESRPAAEREGFEESGYRNRILPLPVKHSQPSAYNPADESKATSRYVREPVITYLSPFGHRKPYNCVQYLVAWYIAETLPPELETKAQQAMEATATASNPTPYQVPPEFPADMSLKERIQQEAGGYEPVKHLHTGVDSDELTYESFLLPIDEACRHVKGSLHESIIKTGWKLIQQRAKEENFKLK